MIYYDEIRQKFWFHDFTLSSSFRKIFARYGLSWPEAYFFPAGIFCSCLSRLCLLLFVGSQSEMECRQV